MKWNESCDRERQTPSHSIRTIASDRWNVKLAFYYAIIVCIVLRSICTCVRSPWARERAPFLQQTKMETNELRLGCDYGRVLNCLAGKFQTLWCLWMDVKLNETNGRTKLFLVFPIRLHSRGSHVFFQYTIISKWKVNFYWNRRQI